MKTKVLVFYPKRLNRDAGGSASRAIEVLGGLRALGCEVMLASSSLYTSTKWDQESAALLRENYSDHVCLYHPTQADQFYARVTRKVLTRVTGQNVSPAAFRTPPGMKSWFKQLAKTWEPQIVLINYVRWDALADQVEPATTKVLETLDLMTLNDALNRRLSPYFSTNALSRQQVPDFVLDEAFLDKQGLGVDPHEFKLFDKYDYTIAISPKDYQLVQETCKKTKSLYIPMTREPVYLDNSYAGDAVFPAGRHLFVLQGYYYFVQKVLPLVLKDAPNFQLAVTGKDNSKFAPANGVTFTGFVPNLESLYATSAFMLCPLLGGTGQPTKIIEGMAHGLAVITNNYAADLTPIEHGRNGFIARTAEEFAEYTILLWRDRALCQKMGQAARKAIEDNYSRSRLVEGLAQIVS